MNDYLTLSRDSAEEYIVNKSRFIGYAMPGSTAEEAVDFINSHGSHHSEAIITENRQTFDYFMRNVDSADILLNASTRFADGYRLGLGAEIGISTGKIHARGPMGMEGLMIYKYVVIGDGHVVKDYSGPGARKYKHIHTDAKYGE